MLINFCGHEKIGVLLEFDLITIISSLCRIIFVLVLLLGYGQRHKLFQNILLVARERRYLLSTKSRYAGNAYTHFVVFLHLLDLLLAL